MALNYLDEYSYLVNEYIEISDFDKLYDKFSDIPCVDKYLIASFVAYMEGHIIVDLKTNSWYLSSFNKHVVLNNIEFPYVFINIYNYIKSNEVFYDFIIKYFNLWHSKENPCFSYDNYHKDELKLNLTKWVSCIQDDIIRLKQDDINKKYSNMFSSILDVVFA